MTGPSLHHGEIVLVPYPLNAVMPSKRRPAVVVSSDHYNSGTGEVMIAPVTSRGRSVPRIGDYAVLDWQEAGLLGPTTVRARIITLRASHVMKVLGALTRRDREGLAGWLRRVLEL